MPGAGTGSWAPLPTDLSASARLLPRHLVPTRCKPSGQQSVLCSKALRPGTLRPVVSRPCAGDRLRGAGEAGGELGERSPARRRHT